MKSPIIKLCNTDECRCGNILDYDEEECDSCFYSDETFDEI